MPGYTKLFNSIITSTLWLEPDHTRLVWITMLALADKNGEIQASVPGLAKLAGVPVEACRTALECLLSPDPDSRTKEAEGRRIVEIEGGWELINHGKYRKMASEEDARQANARRQARHRARNAGVTPSNGVSQPDNAPVTPKSHKQKQETDTPPESRDPDPFPEALRDARFAKAWNDWFSYRRQAKFKAYTAIGASTQLSKLATLGVNRAVSAIYHSIASGYQGIYEPKENQNHATATRNPPLSPANNNLNRNAIESYSKIRQKLSVDVHPGGNGNGGGATDPR